jgi:PAS domain S-box-containing protein
MLSPTAALAHKVDEVLHAQIKDPQSPLPEEVYRLVYELELRASELEDQNDQLRKAHEQLEAYRDRYIDLYDFAPLGYLTLDEDGYVQEINLAGAKLLGAARDELTGYPLHDYVCNDHKKVFSDHLGQCVGERKEVTSELCLVARDGRSVSVQLRSVPIAGPNEEQFCKTAITDITQRKIMEEAIRQSHAFLQTVIDAIPDTLLVIGRDYRILLANRVAREMAGGADPTFCTTCHRLSHHSELPCQGTNEPCPLQQVIASKVPVTAVHTHYDAEGREIFVEVSAAPVFDEAGEVACIVEACRDITDRRRARAALEQERNLLRTLIDNLPDCVYVKDVEGRFLAANLAVARIMGAATPQDVLGKNDADFYPPELAAEYRADEERLLQAGEPLVNKDESRLDLAGELRTVLTTKVPLKDGRGEAYGLVGISRDITDRMRAEEMLRLTQFSIDHAAEPIFWIGPDARIVYANLKACEELGYSREELLALTIHDIDPNFPAEVWPAHWERTKQLGAMTIESQHRAKDGRLMPVEITVNYLGFGGKEYNCAYVHDITARKQAEAAAGQI